MLAKGVSHVYVTNVTGVALKISFLGASPFRTSMGRPMAILVNNAFPECFVLLTVLVPCS